MQKIVFVTKNLWELLDARVLHMHCCSPHLSFQRGHARNHSERSFELEAVAAIVRHNIYNFSVGMRAATHNGLWSWKLLLLLLLCATTFVIPVPHLDSFHTGRTQLYSPGYMSGNPLHGFLKSATCWKEDLHW